MAPRRAVNAFVPPPRSTLAPATNREGYPAWDQPIREQYLQTLLTNTFGAAYYATARELTAESAQIHAAMLIESPAFAAKALVYARNKGYMRTQPIYGLVRLFGTTEGRPLAGRIFDQIIRTPNDLADFTAILKSVRNGEGGRAIKRAAGKWLIKNLDEYRVIKYGAEKAEGAYSLKDMLQVYHPRAPFRAKLPLFDYIMGRQGEEPGKPFWTLHQIEHFERLKIATGDNERAIEIIEGRLPHEVATSFAGTSKVVWEAIVPNLPIFAMLRNLATLERHGVANGCRTEIEKKLLDANTIRSSMILPFRFVEAIKHVHENWLQDALRGALDLAMENIPEIPGLTDVALDISGSMADYIQTAAVFGICLARRSNLAGKLWVFNTELGEMQVSKRDSILSQASSIYAGGGTNHNLVAAYLMQERRKIDNLVYITDEQQNAGSPVINMIDEYRRRVNPRLKLFVIDVGPYAQNGLVPSTPGNYFIYGWSDQALSFISLAAQGFGSMVDAINQQE